MGHLNVFFRFVSNRMPLISAALRSSMAGQFTFYSECGKQTLGCVLGATPSVITEYQLHPSLGGAGQLQVHHRDSLIGTHYGKRPLSHLLPADIPNNLLFSAYCGWPCICCRTWVWLRLCSEACNAEPESETYRRPLDMRIRKHLPCDIRWKNVLGIGFEGESGVLDILPSFTQAFKVVLKRNWSLVWWFFLLFCFVFPTHSFYNTAQLFFYWFIY